MKDFGWVPWVVAAASVAVTIFFGIQNLRLSRRSATEVRGQNEHGRNKDWLEVARGELLARVDATQAKLQLDIKSSDHRLERIEESLTAIRSGVDGLNFHMSAVREVVDVPGGRLFTFLETRFTDVERELGDLAEELGKARPQLPERTLIPPRQRSSGSEPVAPRSATGGSSATDR